MKRKISSTQEVKSAYVPLRRGEYTLPEELEQTFVCNGYCNQNTVDLKM